MTVIALKLLKIEADMSIKTIAKNLAPGKTGDRGAFEIKWNPSKNSESMLIYI
jgi:hypothetical protein